MPVFTPFVVVVLWIKRGEPKLPFTEATEAISAIDRIHRHREKLSRVEVYYVEARDNLLSESHEMGFGQQC
jgi:hypothetical protein